MKQVKQRKTNTIGFHLHVESKTKQNKTNEQTNGLIWDNLVVYREKVREEINKGN